MSKRFLQPGETLRIRTRGMILELRPGPACEIRIVRRRRCLQYRREQAQARVLAELDPRILKDIGLERWHGGTLAERVHMLRSHI